MIGVKEKREKRARVMQRQYEFELANMSKMLEKKINSEFELSRLKSYVDSKNGEDDFACVMRRWESDGCVGYVFDVDDRAEVAFFNDGVIRIKTHGNDDGAYSLLQDFIVQIVLESGCLGDAFPYQTSYS